MYSSNPKLITLAVSALLLAACEPPEPEERGYSYPETRKGDVVEELHGHTIEDPYRWLEALDDDEVREWIEAQNEVTFEHLEGIPGRGDLHGRLEELWDYERYSAPSWQSGRYFYRYNTGLQDHSVLYTMENLDDEPVELIDPNEFSEDGTTSLTMTAVSEDGEKIAYGKAEGGSDWQTFHVREIDSGEDTEDFLEWIKYSPAAWTHDNEGFFYARYPEPEGDPLTAPNEDHRIHYHRLGQDQEDNPLIFETPDHPEWRFAPRVTDDGRYLVVEVRVGTERTNRVFYMDLEDPEDPNLDAEMERLIDEPDARYAFIDNDGETFYFRTTRDADMGKVIAIDLDEPGEGHWTTVVEEQDRVLQGVSTTGDLFALNYLEDAHTRLQLVERDGTHVEDIELPEIGTVSGVSGSTERSEMFFSFTNFTTPSTNYRYDPAEQDEPEVLHEPELADYDPAEFVTTQVFYESRDGTEIPMFVVHHEDVSPDGDNPTLLYGYGGFNISITPSFSVENLAWLEQGGVYASANLRGGGEYGREWHDAGRLENKQNVFDDFAAAADYLIEQDYTRPDQLGIYGRSNGGLLVGATLNQNPELFGAAIPAVGVMDMLRFHKFTVGAGWMSDYGNPEEKEDFETNLAYSPYHNIPEDHDFPPVLVTTADHDDRVVPGHSFKYTARLQERQAGTEPMLIRTETRAGHGAGMPVSMRIEEARDRLGFLAHHLGMEID